MKEIWEPINGYEGLYLISNKGKVKSLERTVVYSNGQTNRHKSILLKPEVTKRGYLRVTLSKNGMTSRYLLHRLVASHFVENTFNKPEVNHKDHIKNNNEASNLEWMTHAENENWNVVCGKQAPNTYKLSTDNVRELRLLKNEGWSNGDLSNKFGISERNVRRVHSRETYKNVE
ncbi:MAG: hypothetical protein K0Q73_5365 [Paenibacillus sp.]|jgi:hypothetical protein|nr:hypothetical protein [Paenibacillus sp.]